MKFSEFVAADPKLEQLMRSARAGRIVHALLFTGPRGTGKNSMAELISRAVLCSHEDENARPCDECPSCRQCLSGNHPDIHVLEPDGKSIKIDMMRDLLEKLGLTSYAGGRKIAVIRRAECMTDQAQNALLKTLEEPTGDTLFFLLAEEADALLPTVRSRCLLVRFSCLEPQDCARALELRGVDAQRARELSALAQGSVGRALEIFKDENYAALRSRVIDALEMLKKPEDVLRAVLRIGDVKEHEREALEIMELWARDLMRVQNGAEPFEINDLAKLRKSTLDGSRLLRCLTDARARMEANISWTNVFEPMALNLTRSGVLHTKG